MHPLIVKSINTAQALDIQNSLFQQKNNNLDIEKDIQIMKSNVIIDRVIDSLPLQVSYYRSGNILNEELYRNSPFLVFAKVNDPQFYDRSINFRILSHKEFQLDHSSDGAGIYETYEFNKHYSTPAFDFTVQVNEPIFKRETPDELESTIFFTINNGNTNYNTIRNALQVAPSAPTIALLMRIGNRKKRQTSLTGSVKNLFNTTKKRKRKAQRLYLNLSNRKWTLSAMIFAGMRMR
ncbi:MAG: hypothetical protein IPO83_05775 [Chitinophagaceae bacterium]|nr:hypothetical protein [Chitinophagaceae bacterium]